jgi:hypothetical protein
MALNARLGSIGCRVAALWVIGLVSVTAVSQQRQGNNPAKPPDTSQGLAIFQVSISAPSFVPSLKETVQLRYSLSRDAAVTVKVFDPDFDLVRVVTSKTPKKTGANRETWDGRDMNGKIVPNEAYFFTIEAEAPGLPAAVYDPVTFSGGEFGDITRGEMSKDSGEITYQLSQPSRVRLRTGIQGSAMVKTVVDWEPRVAGTITERWDGKDEDNLITVWNRDKFIMLLSYITLPDASVIAVGNRQLTYRTYKTTLTSPRPKKEERPMVNNRRISPHFSRSRLNDRAFRIRLSFPEIEKGKPVDVPEVKGRVLVHVDVAPEDRAILLNQQYEVMLFGDFLFHAEEERGYLPFNFPWEVTELPPGEHILTVNINSHGDQVGVGSRRVRVVK